MPDVLGFTFLIIKDLIISMYGKNRWKNILMSCNIDDDFSTHRQYDINLFNKLVISCCNDLNLNTEKFLEITGYWFYFFARNNGYRDIIELGGKTLPEILMNVNKIHLQVRETFNTKTPSIWISDVTDQSLILYYIPSDPSRVNWTSFLCGIITGIAENKYGLRGITLHILERIIDGYDHDKILITWIQNNNIGKDPRLPTRSPSEILNSNTSSPSSTPTTPTSPITSPICPFSQNSTSIDDIGIIERSVSFTSDDGFSQTENNDDNSSYKYGLSYDHFKLVFPFHFVINKDLRFIQMGDSLSQLLPNVRIGDFIGNIFSLVHPQKNFWDFKFILKNLDKPFTLSFNFDKLKKVNLFGQMLFRKDKHVIYYICSVDIFNIQDACYLGLSISNFADHDIRKGIMFKTSLENQNNNDQLKNIKGMKVSSRSDVFKRLFNSNEKIKQSDENLISDTNEFDNALINKLQGELQKNGLEFINLQLNFLERQQLLHIFADESCHKLYTNNPHLENTFIKILVGKALCYLIQNGYNSKLHDEIIDSGCMIDIINFIEKHSNISVHTKINTNDVILLETIGSGSMGIVKKALLDKSLSNNNFHVAVKIINTSAATDMDKSDFKRELSIMTLLNHPNLVNCIGGYYPLSGDSDGLLVMPLLPKTLYKTIHEQKLSWSEKYSIAKGIAEGMFYLHKLGILHRDLKSGNCLLTEKLVPKLADFGLSKPYSKHMTKAVGTTSWMAPEVLFGKKYDFTADIYSYGIILWELLTGEEPYHNLQINQIFDFIRKGGRPTLPLKPTNIQKLVIKIIRKCWHTNPSKRGNFNDILQSLKELEKEIFY